jgi:hypothetical protein
MSNYEQRTYEVRYPDGERTTIQAFSLTLTDGAMYLKKAPGDNPGNVLFAASHEAGVTIRQVSAEEAEHRTAVQAETTRALNDPVSTGVEFEVDGEHVRDGKPGEKWIATYYVPTVIAQRGNLTEAQAEGWDFPHYTRADDDRHTPDGCKDSCPLAVDHDGPCP